jgi:glycosyltransferase involved in cell wall biosynthesis
LSRDPKEIDLKRFYTCNYLSYLQENLSQNEACRVSFAGTVPHKLLNSFYNNADICVVPSVCNEPCGVPILEAMATGIPVIATRSGGTPELIIDGETGLLVERDDASALAKAILRLLSDEELRKSMGKAARKRAVELFSWEKISRDLLVQYENLVS